jgi:D-alanyl-D-alanine carboxypeptidase
MNEPHMLPARRRDGLYTAITLTLGVLLLPAAILRHRGRARELACAWALRLRFPAEDLTGLAPGTLTALTAARTEAFWRDHQLIGVTSGYRDAATQLRLFLSEVRRSGSPESARAWVLPPSESRHVHGTALDVRPVEGARWLERHGGRHDLHRVYANEWWHFEYQPGRRRAPSRRPEPGMDRGSIVRSRRPSRPWRRSGLVLGASTLVIILVAVTHRSGSTASFPVPGEAALTGLSLPRRIVAIAESQVGYSAKPSSSYCNRYSAYWGAGTTDCPSGERAEKWCADFAAWAWRAAGAHFTYGYAPGQLNGAAVSFYEWGVANGEWHPARSGYRAWPGDVAVYGLSLGVHPSAEHVAIVTDDPPGRRGPDVVNGDGDRTGFSVVETGTSQVRADAGHRDSALAGYVSPPRPAARQLSARIR